MRTAPLGPGLTRGCVRRCGRITMLAPSCEEGAGRYFGNDEYRYCQDYYP
jgi:hypothetical protein